MDKQNHIIRLSHYTLCGIILILSRLFKLRKYYIVISRTVVLKMWSSLSGGPVSQNHFHNNTAICLFHCVDIGLMVRRQWWVKLPLPPQGKKVEAPVVIVLYTTSQWVGKNTLMFVEEYAWRSSKNYFIKYWSLRTHF